ncbi:hypothetical protein [Agreia sp. Leaf283]|uniref:hypothetical protein n=1 Tax=Agreia sp. Leaf283 TaxID=1736321 RepID=UPI0007007828|nr:hypothetical protein [Agreia sp. Leaf283]KQP53877.1 hypothetical protein ASF51_17220 [Agreia sp. Leaf283]
MSTLEAKAGMNDTTGRSTPRPAWSLWSGIGIATGGALLLIATLLEIPLLDDPNSGVLGLFAVTFLASTIIHAAAMVPLTGGATGDAGAVGRSLLGRFALLGFGGLFLTSQIVYFVVVYAMPAVDDYSGVLSLTTGLGLAQLVLLLVGSLVIVRAGVATGSARWALLALTVVAIVTGVVGNATDSTEVATSAHLVSTVTQIVVGIVFIAYTPRHHR